MIGIVDYKLGNVRAFANIYNELGIAYSIADTPAAITASDRLILPGVGAFDTAMQYLENSGLRPAIEAKVQGEGRPVLGVCVGMQMLFDRSDEGKLSGLGWLPGSVVKFSQAEVTGSSVPLVPHMGWNTVTPTATSSLFFGFSQPAEFYFLHSYYCVPENANDVIATCHYPSPFACVAGNERVFGVQCHPEKSHGAGIQLLRNFAEL
jgi:imidazole glycerol-phosphate synthase subunit HisH